MAMKLHTPGVDPPIPVTTDRGGPWPWVRLAITALAVAACLGFAYRVFALAVWGQGGG